MIFVLGYDGFCGWATINHLKEVFSSGVMGIDNFSRRKIDEELNISSLTPIASIGSFIMLRLI